MLCNANPRDRENTQKKKKKKQRTIVTKNSNKAQGSCQKDSI